MAVCAFPHTQRRRAVACQRLSRLACKMTVENLRMIYHHCGREAFLTACDELMNAGAAIREHEERKAEAGMPLGPDTGTEWQGGEAWEQ